MAVRGGAAVRCGAVRCGAVRCGAVRCGIAAVRRARAIVRRTAAGASRSGSPPRSRRPQGCARRGRRTCRAAPSSRSRPRPRGTRGGASTGCARPRRLRGRARRCDNARERVGCGVGGAGPPPRRVVAGARKASAASRRPPLPTRASKRSDPAPRKHARSAARQVACSAPPR
eukprot:3367698-Prymnesium_polylepis.1